MEEGEEAFYFMQIEERLAGDLNKNQGYKDPAQSNALLSVLIGQTIPSTSGLRRAP